MQLWSRGWTRKELLDRVGSLSQLGGVTRFEYVDGKAKGVNALRVRTAAGLEFSILPEKGMDIVEASYRGQCLGWHSPVGIVHPAYYDARDFQWLKSFPGGLISTCGMLSAGMPSEDAGEQWGLHGAVSNTPAEHITWDEQWEDDDCRIIVRGCVRETRVHGPNLLLNRTISTSLSSRTIFVHDSVENQGFQDAPLMMLYHLNFGFPLLTEHSRIYAPSKKIEPRNENAAATQATWAQFEPPTAGIQERVYYHEMKADSQGKVTVVLVSDDRRRDFGIAIQYSAAGLPRFVQWKMTGANHFALGLEPSNCLVAGRRAEREAGTLRILRPGEKQDFEIALHVLDGEQEVSTAQTGAGLRK